MAGAPSAVSQQAPQPNLYPFSEKPAIPLLFLPKTGYVDLTGRVVIPFRFDYADDFVQGRARVTLQGKYGFIDPQGQLVVAAKYDSASDYSDDRAVVRVGQLWGVIDRDGQEIVPSQYRFIRPFSEGLAVVTKPSDPKEPMRYGAIDVAGRAVIEPEYDYLSDFTDGRAAVRRDGKFGFISATGKLVIPAIYDVAAPFKDGLALVGKRPPDGSGNCTWLMGDCILGKIDIDGNVVTPLVFGRLDDLKNGRAVAAETSRSKVFHFVDRTGTRISPDISFDKYCNNTLPFDPLGRLKSPAGKPLAFDPSGPLKSPGGKCMFADDDGNNRFDRDFENAWPFVDGLAVVRVGAQEGFGPIARTVKQLYAGVIDTRGAFVVPPVFDQVLLDKPGVIQVSFGDRHGDYVDRQGKPLTFTTAELNHYIVEMRDALNLAGYVAGRTITAQVAGIDYHFYLPRGFCALDSTEAMDATIFAEWSERLAAMRKKMEESSKVDPSVLPSVSVSGLFAPCEQLREFRETGQRNRLKQVGRASGLRRRPEPSSGEGIPFITAIICRAMMRGVAVGSGVPQPEVRTERISQAWAQVAAGQQANLPAINIYALGCTSAALSPGEGASVAATAVTMGMLPDWSFEINDQMAPKDQNNLVEALAQEAALFGAIVNLNLRAQIR